MNTNPIFVSTIKKNIMTQFELKQHWEKRLLKLQTKNRQNQRFDIGSGHTDIQFRLTQLAIKFKI